MDTRQLLLLAADHIERHGKIEGKWIPDEVAGYDGVPESHDCPACVGGALAMVVTDYRTYSPSFVLRPSEKETMRNAIELLVESSDLHGDVPEGYSLDWAIEWSDTHSQAEVVAGLRKAAG